MPHSLARLSFILTLTILGASLPQAQAAESTAPATTAPAVKHEKKATAKKAKTAKAAPQPAASPEPVAHPSAVPSPQPTIQPSPEPVIEPSAAPSPIAEVPVAPPVAEAPEQAEPRGYGRTHGLLGPVTFGPTVTLLSIPHPLQVGIESKFKDIFGASFMLGVLPKITVGSNSIKMDSFDVGLHWHPFRGSFFIGGTIGKQKLTGTKTQVLTGTVASVPYSESTTLEVTLETTTLTPMLGWRWEWHSGFFYGLELGWQFASNPKAGFTTTPETPAAIQATPDYQSLQADLDKAANDYGKQGLPHFTLIQIGWLF